MQIQAHLRQAIDKLAAEADPAGTDNVLSVYVWPYHFGHNPGFCVEPEQADQLRRYRCSLNVVFMANNAGPLRR